MHTLFIEAQDVQTPTATPADSTAAPADTTPHPLFDDYTGNGADAVLHQQQFQQMNGVDAANGHLGLSP